MAFFPQQSQFFDLLAELTSTIVQASQQLSLIKIGSKNNKKIALKVQKLEIKADEFSHLLKHEADKAFITPIDRDDIHLLANSLNTIIDYIENVTTSIYLFDIKGTDNDFKNYSELIFESIQILNELMSDLSFKSKYLNRMRVNIKAVHHLEKKGDELTRNALMNLFLTIKKPIIIIKWKHVYDNLEQILDACEQTADAVDGVIVKNF
jgi:uncharacterized protein